MMPLDTEDSPRTHTLDDDEDDQLQQDLPQNKRRRTEHGMYRKQTHPMLTIRFPPGSILRVSMKNFVTYTNAEFFAGPNMNLVIGPNGSGKSTIVCAICLGLGYPPTVLGRATATGDYVQHGKDSAEVEIELADKDDKTLIIKRKLMRDKNVSVYYVNGLLPRYPR
jgi:structural maintenance of chromosomes protein 5